jgi:hypothetical protein
MNAGWWWVAGVWGAGWLPAARWCYGWLRAKAIKYNESMSFADPVREFDSSDKVMVTFAACGMALIWPLFPAVAVAMAVAAVLVRFIQGSTRLSEPELKKIASRERRARQQAEDELADARKEWDQQFTQLGGGGT